MSQAAVPGPEPSPRRPRALSINLTVGTMLTVAAIVGLAWAFVYIREAVMTLFLALFVALVLEPVVRLMQRTVPPRPWRLRDDPRSSGSRSLRSSLVLLLLIPLAGSFRDFVQALPGHDRRHHEQLVARLSG